jgi:hypothetical protein
MTPAIDLLAVVRSMLRGIVVLALFVVVLAGAPSLAVWLDARGWPGGAIALGSVLALAAISASVTFRDLPRARRGRALSRAARSRGYRWRPSMSIPRSMASLPTFSDPARSVTTRLFNLIAIGEEAGAPIVFDRSILADPGYWFAQRATAAARHLEGSFGPLAIRPRRWRIADGADLLPEFATGLGSVDERWRVGAADRAFASAFLDQRMLMWIDALEPSVMLEVGGRWAMLSTRRLRGPEDWPALVGTLDGFVERIPRVVGSLYPPQPNPMPWA